STRSAIACSATRARCCGRLDRSPPRRSFPHMPDTLQERIAGALSRVRNPRTGRDVTSDGMIRDIATTTGGKVRLTLLLGADDPATLVRDVRQALERIEGVTEARVDVKDPK